MMTTPTMTTLPWDTTQGNATTSGSGNVFVGHDAGSSRTTIGGATCVGFGAGST